MSREGGIERPGLCDSTFHVLSIKQASLGRGPQSSDGCNSGRMESKRAKRRNGVFSSYLYVIFQVFKKSVLKCHILMHIFEI